jgi:hypothetical protein
MVPKWHSLCAHGNLYSYRAGQRFHQVRILFQDYFDLIFCEESLGCLPRRPELNMMVFRLQRR